MVWFLLKMFLLFLSGDKHCSQILSQLLHKVRIHQINVKLIRLLECVHCFSCQEISRGTTSAAVSAEELWLSYIISYIHWRMSKHKLQTVRAAGLEQMDAHMNKLQRSKHAKHSSSLPALPRHTKCYSSHIEEYNENITLGERCCAPSRGWQMDGDGNMLQHPRPATILAELSDTQVSTTSKLMLPTLTQLLPADPYRHCLYFTYLYVIVPHSFVSSQVDSIPPCSL